MFKYILYTKRNLILIVGSMHFVIDKCDFEAGMWCILPLKGTKLNNLNFPLYLKLCLATATHNSKWLKITHICLILV